MINPGERFAQLSALAQVNDSEQRRELLRGLCDLFRDGSSHGAISEIENHMFGDLLVLISREMDVEVRKQLARDFSEGPAPSEIVKSLAMDEIGVADPILRHSKVLADGDLVDIIKQKDDNYRNIIAQRQVVSPHVSGALVAHGSDKVLHTLLKNEGAHIDGDTYSAIAVRAESNETLQGPLVRRKTIPLDVLNQLYTVVSGPMKAEILERNKAFSATEVDAAIARAQAKIGVAHGALPSDYEKALAEIKGMINCGRLTPAILPNLWREGKHTAFKVGFSELTGVSFHLLMQIINRADMDTLAMICRGSGYDRALFVTLAVLLLGEPGLGQAEALGKLYLSVPEDAAARALRFFKMHEKLAA